MNTWLLRHFAIQRSSADKVSTGSIGLNKTATTKAAAPRQMAALGWSTADQVSF